MGGWVGGGVLLLGSRCGAGVVNVTTTDALLGHGQGRGEGKGTWLVNSGLMLFHGPRRTVVGPN